MKYSNIEKACTIYDLLRPSGPRKKIDTHPGTTLLHIAYYKFIYMPMIKVWIHLVWATKSRQPLLEKYIRQNVFQHMRNNAKEKGVHVDFINGHFDHVHLLISLNADQTIAKTVQLIKGESSHWINENKLTAKYFDWQDDYFAVSVSESGVNRVRNYIKNQEQRHLKKTFQEECDEFVKRYGFVLMKDALG